MHENWFRNHHFMGPIQCTRWIKNQCFLWSNSLQVGGGGGGGGGKKVEVMGGCGEGMN